MNQSKVVSLLIAIAMLSQMAFLNFQPSKPQVEMDLIEGHPAPITLPEENNSDAPQYVPDVVLLGVRGGITITTGSLNQSVETNSTSLRMVLDSIGSLSVKPLFSNEKALRSTEQDTLETDPSTIYRLQLKPGTDVEHAVDALTRLPEVTFAEPDYLAYSADISEPTPSQLSSALTVTQLTIDDPLYSQQWGLAKIDIENAWDDTYGSPTVTIAVIDSGIDLTHVDLQNNLWVNPGETAGNSVDDDSNGYIDDVDGWNFVFSSNDVWDDNGHGTLVAGVAAGIGGNGQGIVGVCPECRIMPIKVMQASGVANYSDIAAGVLYAAQKGAKVINLSLGGYANSNTLKNAIDTAVNTYGVVVVAGAGNDNLNTPFYPAAYDNVLAVAGTAEDDAKLDFSNYAAWVDVSAPAVNVRTTALGGDWANGSGTSIASPFAAGLAGLLRVLHPDWNQATICSQIVHTTDNIDSINPTFFGMLGSGRLNAGVAMQPPHPILSMAGYAIDGQTNGRPVLGTSASLVLTLENDWWDALGVTGTLSTTDPLVTITSSTASFGDIPAADSKTNTTTFAFTVDNSAGYNHPIAFTLDVTDTTDYSNSFNFTINTETGVENKSGTLITQTWTNDKTYLITNNISVPTGNTLTIEPGTVIKFNGNFMLSVRGTLIADGTADLPIQFKSNTAGTWDKIFFDDLNIDAVADVDGNYLSGSILRFVNIEGNTGGITCTTATPYLSNVNLQGSITCSLGINPIWLLDSTFMGSASFTGTGTAYRNTISGSLSISGAGVAEDNSTGDVLSLGSGFARRNIAGGLTIGGSGGSLEDNTVSGGDVSLGDSFNVVGNVITGSLTTGNSATVDHNTVSNGMTVGTSATVTWNNVENASGTGLTSGTNVTAQYNRLIGNTTGMTATTGLIEHNLIANNTGMGLQVGAATVRYNTFTGNQGDTILVQSGNPVTIEHNNLEGNTGTYDLFVNIASGINISVLAQNNWWGITDTALIDARIWDYWDDDTKATVNYSPILTEPDQTAPGYVRNIIVSPDTLGIQTGIFDVQFSKPMDNNNSPDIVFYNNIKGTWSHYDTTNSGLPNNFVNAIAIEANGTKWFGTKLGVASFDGINWTVHYNPPSAGLPVNDFNSISIEPNGTKWFGSLYGGVTSFDGTNWITYMPSAETYVGGPQAIATDAEGTKWIGTSAGRVASFDGTTWTEYNSSNSGLPSNTESVHALAIEGNGTKWFGTENYYAGYSGSTSFDGINWTAYNSLNSALHDKVYKIAVDGNDTKWFGIWQNEGGVISFDGFRWQVYEYRNSGIQCCNVTALAIDANNTKWFGTESATITSGVSSFDGTHWTVYNSSNSGLMNNRVFAIGIESNGTKWFGTYGGGVSVLHGADEYHIIDNQQWPSSSMYHATYDITSAIPKAIYRVKVSDAFDLDGMRVAPYSNTTFNVDYAGFISDTTPPVQPTVTASGDGTLTTISASWSSSDAESPITQYRYGIGTTPGGRDVVAWTYVSSVTTSMIRTGLNLTSGQPYYVTVGARNEGGLWSEDGVGNGVIAGVVPPVSFNKDTPANGATGVSISSTLSWAASSGAVSYEYCYDTTDDDACSLWINNGTSTSKVLSGLTNATTYYWHVRAINPGGTTYANTDTWWSFTTVPDTPPTFSLFLPLVLR